MFVVRLAAPILTRVCGLGRNSLGTGARAYGASLGTGARAYGASLGTGARAYAREPALMELA